MEKGIRDPNQDSCRDQVAMPMLLQLFKNYNRDFGGGCSYMAPSTREGGTCRVQQVSFAEGKSYDTFSIRCYRSECPAASTEFDNLEAIQGKADFKGSTLLFGQAFVSRPWKAPVVNAAVTRLDDLLMACKTAEVRETVDRKTGYLARFYVVSWASYTRPLVCMNPWWLGSQKVQPRQDLEERQILDELEGHLFEGGAR